MILMVDDDLVVKQVLKKWLAAAGHKCLVANSAEQGWRVIKDFAQQIWLVILDVHMPGKYDGIGLLDRIIEVAQIRSLKVLMISSSQQSITRAVDHGCEDFMTKPLIRPLLLKKVETLRILSCMEEEREADTARVAAARSSHRLTIDKLLTFWEAPHIQHVFPTTCMQNCIATKLTDWSFNVFDFSEDQLVVLAKCMFSAP